MPSTINATPTSSGLIQTADNSGVLALQTGGTTAVTIDGSQNVMVNSSTLFDPNGYASSGGKFLQVKATTTDRGAFVNILGGGGGSPNYWVGGINYAISGQTYPAATIFSYTGASSTSGILGFTTSSDTTSTPTERMRITSGGNVLINSTTGGQPLTVKATPNGGNAAASFYIEKVAGQATDVMYFYSSNNSLIGYIGYNGSQVTYNATSDYRLKDNITPITGALAKVEQLKPCTYTWKQNNANGHGFIAHELAEVFPDAVSGEKDAIETYIDEDGNEQTRIRPQGIDTSFLVATLTAAIQELKAQVDAQALEIQALKGASA